MNCKKSVISLLIASMLNAGCATTEVAKTAEVNIKRNAEQTTLKARELESKTTPPPVVERTGGVWFAGKQLTDADKKVVFPASFKRNIVLERPTTLQEVAERITIRTGIPVTIDSDLQQADSGSTGSGSGASTSNSSSSSSTNAPLLQTANIRYSGTVEGLLNTISARFGIQWKYENGMVRFHTLTTETFVLHAIPGDSTLNASISSGSTSGGGSAGGSSSGASSQNGVNASVTNGTTIQSTSMTSSLSIWKSTDEAVRAMLSPRGKVVVSPATGSITVTDTPQIVSRVAEYIKKQNANMTKQVYINVRVLSVSLSDTEDYGLNWNLVFQNVTKQFGFLLANSFPIVGGTDLTMQILESANGHKGVNQFAGSEAVFSALSNVGKVSTITSATLTSLNNQPTPLQVGRQIGYLQSSSTTNTPNVGSTTELIPGTINTGFSMNLLPHLLNDGKMLLQYSIDISSLNRLNTVTSGASTIQTPELDTRNFMQRIGMRSGQTLVLSGFEQAADNLDKGGMFDPDNTWAGGGRRSRTSRDVIVVIMTPVVVEGV